MIGFGGMGGLRSHRQKRRHLLFQIYLAQHDCHKLALPCLLKKLAFMFKTRAPNHQQLYALNLDNNLGLVIDAPSLICIRKMFSFFL